jgi:hypothetical protein
LLIPVAAALGVSPREPRYHSALFHLLVSQTSCFRYWGEGPWTGYGREVCRRTLRPGSNPKIAGKRRKSRRCPRSRMRQRSRPHTGLASPRCTARKYEEQNEEDEPRQDVGPCTAVCYSDF